MAYTQLTMSPATIEFARKLGATGVHIGILGALPTAMLFAQFLAAVVANHLTSRRWLWFSVSLIQRLVLVPLALGPIVFPEVEPVVWIWGLIFATAVNHAMLHFCTPLWLSWMGDYLPRDGLSRFWGVRHLWMQWSAAASLLFGAVFLLKSGVAIGPAFAVMVCVGAVCGVIDLFIFLGIEEPPVPPMPKVELLEVLSAPLRNHDFRSYITYACFWNFAAMIGAPFISFYVLMYLGVDLFHMLMLWAMSWVGGAVLSSHFGNLVEKFGNRPLLILCTGFKATNMLALLLVPRDPTLAFWILVPVFMFDALLNSGIAIASNGFMLKNSPSQNRSMYIAAGTALAGMVGGLTSILAGLLLTWIGDRALRWGSWEMNGFHLLFISSLVLRLASVFVARQVRELDSQGTRVVVTQLIGATPMRMLRFPVGLYRSTVPEALSIEEE